MDCFFYIYYTQSSEVYCFIQFSVQSVKDMSVVFIIDQSKAYSYHIMERPLILHDKKYLNAIRKKYLCKYFWKNERKRILKLLIVIEALIFAEDRNTEYC